jgi:STAS domain-containing protein
VGRVRSVLASPRGEPLRRVVFDLSNVTFMDVAALTAILRADQQGRGDGFEVVVVRPPLLGGRVFTLSRAREHLTIVDHPREATVDDRQGARFGSDGGETAIEFRRLAREEISTCVRCRSNHALWEAGVPVVGGLVMLVSPDGPICGGCITKTEQIELGEAILGDLRLREPRDEERIRALEEALAELHNSKAAD